MAWVVVASHIVEQTVAQQIAASAFATERHSDTDHEVASAQETALVADMASALAVRVGRP